MECMPLVTDKLLLLRHVIRHPCSICSYGLREQTSKCPVAFPISRYLFPLTSPTTLPLFTLPCLIHGWCCDTPGHISCLDSHWLVPSAWITLRLNCSSLWRSWMQWQLFPKAFSDLRFKIPRPLHETLLHWLHSNLTTKSTRTLTL